MPKQKRYATIDNPTISAVVHELYRFKTAQEALDLLGTLKVHFIIAKTQIENPKHPSVILWIKGFGVEEADKAKGVIGNYAVIAVKEIKGKFALAATKMQGDVKDHPQRAQVKRDNPNWGHPVLRAVRKKKTYPTFEAAQAELSLLHEHFPKVSIPNPGKLYIMIYCADRPAKQRMVKHTLEIETTPEGQYFIDINENTYTPKPKVPAALAPAGETPQGAFTARIALKRNKKARKPTESASAPAGD